MGPWDSAAVLTREDLDRAFQQIRDEELQPHEHVVHPDAQTRDGWYACDCGMLPVHDGRVDWDWGLDQLRAAGLLRSP